MSEKSIAIMIIGLFIAYGSCIAMKTAKSAPTQVIKVK